MRTITSRMQFLIQFDILPPEAYDFVFPHGPKLSKPLIDVIAAQVVRDIAKQLPEQAKQFVKPLSIIGREMTQMGAEGLVAGWEEGDDLCPPFKIPFPFPPKKSLGFEEITEDFGFYEKNHVDTLRTFSSALKVIGRITSFDRARKELPNIAQDLEKIERNSLR